MPFTSSDMAEDVGPLLMLVPLIGEDGMVLVSAFECCSIANGNE